MERSLRCLGARLNAIPSIAHAAMRGALFVAASWLTSHPIVHAYDPPPAPCDEATLAAPRPESLGDNEQRPIQHHWMFEVNKRGRLFLKSPDDQFFLQVRGLLQLDYRSFPAGQEKGSPRVVEPGFFVQRARPTFLACVYRQIKIRLSPDFGNGIESPPQLFTANVEWDRFSYAHLAYGLMKVPASLEVMQSIQDLPFMERSLVRNLVPLIAIGGTVSGQVWENTLNYQIGFWNDTRSGNFFEVGKVFKPPTTVTVRVFLHPFSRHGSWLAGLGLGLGLTQGWIFDEAGLIPLQTETLSLTFFQLNPNVVGDGPRMRLLPQLSWYWKRAGFMAEYLYRSNRDKIVNGPSARFTDEAWSVQGSFFLTEDAASPGGVHPRRPFTVMRPGHWGAWQIALRHSELTLDQDIFALRFADPLRNARHAESTTVALNWYLDSSLRLTAHYVHTDLAGAGPSYIGVRQEDGLMFRVQITY